MTRGLGKRECHCWTCSWRDKKALVVHRAVLLSSSHCKNVCLQAAPEGSGRRFKLGKMAIRTRWFDDQIEAALGMPVAGKPGAAVAAALVAHGLTCSAAVTASTEDKSTVWNQSLRIRRCILPLSVSLWRL